MTRNSVVSSPIRTMDMINDSHGRWLSRTQLIVLARHRLNRTQTNGILNVSWGRWITPLPPSSSPASPPAPSACSSSAGLRVASQTPYRFTRGAVLFHPREVAYPFALLAATRGPFRVWRSYLRARSRNATHEPLFGPERERRHSKRHSSRHLVVIRILLLLLVELRVRRRLRLLHCGP